MFQYTTAIDKVRNLTARKKVVQGGKDAGKTWAILPNLINDAIEEPLDEVSIVSDTMPSLRRGAIRDFLKIMKDTGRYRPQCWNKSSFTYTFPNGSWIEFFSADSEDKVRGPRRKKLYINEANRLDFETYHQLAGRTSGDIYIDFNPTSEFWAHTEVLKEPDAEHLILTYKDNEAVSQHVIDDFAIAETKAADGSKYWQNYIRVYRDGQIGQLQGSVFERWDVVEDVPEKAKLLGYGLDFGWEAPAAVVAVYQMDNRYYFDEVIYESKLSNQAIARMLLDIDIGGDMVIADYAEPKSIEEIRREGINIHGCDSKTDIRPYAIRRLNNDEFFATKQSENIISELRGYIWDRDSKGVATGKPKKGNDHAMDALIYFVGTVDKFDGSY